MAHKHHPKEARIRAVQQQDGGRSASEICKDMNITPSTLKRWRDQLGSEFGDSCQCQTRAYKILNATYEHG